MSSAPVKRGYLYKLDEDVYCCCRVHKNWKKRFVVLTAGSLFYYESPDSVKSKGQMSLYGAACILAEFPKVSRQHSLEISTPQRTLYISAETEDDIKEWAIAIQKAAMLETTGSYLESLESSEQTPLAIRSPSSTSYKATSAQPENKQPLLNNKH